MFRSSAHVPIVPCVAGLLAVLSWCVPNHDKPWTSFHGQVVMAAAFLLLASWSLWRHRHLPVELPAVAVAVLLLMWIPALQWRAGQVPFTGDAWLGALYLLGSSLSLAFGYRLSQAEGFDRVVGYAAWVLVAGGLASSALGLYQAFHLDFLGAFVVAPPDSRPVGNLAQVNNLATLLVLAVCGLAWLYLHARMSAALAVPVLLVILVCLVMTQSRTGMLGIGLLTAALLWHRESLGTRRTLRSVAVGVTMFGLALLFFALLASTEGAAVRSATELASGGKRALYWPSVIDAIWRQPWFGYGWNQTALAQVTVALDHAPVHSIFSYSHNLVLDLLLWFGVPIGAAFSGLLIAWCWRVTRRQHIGVSSTSAVLPMTAVVVVLVHALLEFPLYYSYFLVPTGLLMGAIDAAHQPLPALRAPRGLLPTAVAGATVLITLVILDYVALEGEQRAIRFQQARIGLHVSQPAPPPVRVLTQLQALNEVARHLPLDPADAVMRERLRAVAKRYPFGMPVLHHAAALALEGHPAAAQAALAPYCHTHTPAHCQSAQAYWRSLAGQDARLAAVAFPGTDR